MAIEREPVAQTWLWYEAWLRDPAGNAICLYNAGENRRYPPWRIERTGRTSESVPDFPSHDERRTRSCRRTR